MKYAAIGPIEIHLPERIETNDQLGAEFPEWHMELIHSKTGIRARHIAAPGECSSDLGVKAAENLFQRHKIDRSSIDFLLFCTQTPDYPLPTTACLMQDRLGLRTSIGALDFNLGCSGYIYGLSLAEGLIRSGAARRVLFVTAETYSKYIDPADRSLRTIFGDGAAATLIDAADKPSLEHFKFGTDGRGGDTLLMTKGGIRPAEQAITPRHRQRWPSPLYMDGPSLINITLETVPPIVAEVLKDAKIDRSQVDLFLLHQATLLMLTKVRERLEVGEEKFPVVLEDVGNTVSSTIPLMIYELRRTGRLKPEMLSVMVGFGVGFSLGACLWRETWHPK